MAKGAKISIRVQQGRSAMTISYWTNGLIARLTANDVRNVVVNQPLLPTTGSKAFWEAVLTVVNTDITAGHGGGS